MKHTDRDRVDLILDAYAGAAEDAEFWENRANFWENKARQLVAEVAHRDGVAEEHVNVAHGIPRSRTTTPTDGYPTWGHK